MHEELIKKFKETEIKEQFYGLDDNLYQATFDF